MLASMIRSRGGLVIVEYIYLLVPLLGAICFSHSSNFEFAEIDRCRGSGTNQRVSTAFERQYSINEDTAVNFQSSFGADICRISSLIRSKSKATRTKMVYQCLSLLVFSSSLL